jgi:FdhD protein
VNPSISKLPVWKRTPEGFACSEDFVAREEPLALQLGYSIEQEREQRELAITMRTPGEDLALALGFLFSEGVIRSLSDIDSIRHCEQSASLSHTQNNAHNIVKIELSEACAVPAHIFKRHSFISSSCGVCGKASLDAVHMHRCLNDSKEQSPHAWKVNEATIRGLPETLLAKQRVFGATGGLHASALFDLEGNLLSLHEDVGRHNALDKLVGTALSQSNLPLHRHILLLSGRASFELLQKAAMAGVQLVCAVGAPSSLAVECAREFAITLIGFLKKERFNVYSSPHRIEGIPDFAANREGTGMPPLSIGDASQNRPSLASTGTV